jgi:UPF0755 protein
MSALFRIDKGFHKKRSFKVPLIIFVIIILLVFLGALFVYRSYVEGLNPVDEVTSTSIEVVIEPGATPSEIASQLEDSGVIRSAMSFEWYIRLNGLRSGLLAGTYIFSTAEPVEEIVKRLREGDITLNLFTVLPAQRIDQIRDAMVEFGFEPSDISEALDANNYRNHPALRDLPADGTLEGYLYPESYLVDANSTPKTVVELALDQMSEVITPELEVSLVNAGFSLHDAVILSSIIEREVSDENDRRTVAQVFIKRLQEGMQLGSDPTALYGALQAGIEPSVFADTPYNTRLYEGLPPGPINNISENSLLAIVNPSDTEYLYFVSGDDGNTYFSFTLEQHEALTAEHCVDLCRSY